MWQKCSAQAELTLTSALGWQVRVTKLQDSDISFIHNRRESGNKPFYFEKSGSCTGFCVSANVDGFTITIQKLRDPPGALLLSGSAREAVRQGQAGHMSHTEVWIFQTVERTDCAKVATITASIPSTRTGANKSSLKAQLRDYKDEGFREICTMHRKL